MKILHTSDWHLGRSLFGRPRFDEHRAFLAWFAQTVRELDVDAVVISGDIYDRAVPPIESVRMLEGILVELTEVCPVIMIAGNHDSPYRLGFASPLLERARLHLRARLDDVSRPVTITGSDGVEAVIYGLPYLQPDEHREALGVERSHRAVLSAAMDRVRADVRHRDSRSLVLAHAFIVGDPVAGDPTGIDGADAPEESESELDLRVGGIAHAPVSVFDGLDYVALGHLHGAQQVRTSGDMRAAYSGSPLAFSFSEERHTKSVSLVEIPTAGPVTVRHIPVPVVRPLVTLRGTFEELEESAEFAEHEQSWVRAFYTDLRRIDSASYRLEKRFAFVVETQHEAVGGLDPTRVQAAVDVRAADPVDVVAEFVRYVTDSDPDDRERSLIAESVDRVGQQAVPR